MKIPANVHTHTRWCDGSNTTDEMAKAALEKGMTGIGFSSHAPAPFDPSCPGVQDMPGYLADVARIKQAYAGQLDVLCGIEQDYYTPVDRAQFDYIIGSVHYMPVHDGKYNAADGDADHVLAAKRDYYKDDGLAMARAYYGLVVENAQKYRPEIVGHFDVLTKTNKNGSLFDEDGKAYQTLALEALDAVLEAVQPYGGIVEMNTGAMSRGYRDLPYPAPFLLRRLAEKGARVMPTSDSHSAKTLDYALPRCVELMRQAGFASVTVMQGGMFLDVPL